MKPRELEVFLFRSSNNRVFEPSRIKWSRLCLIPTPLLPFTIQSMPRPRCPGITLKGKPCKRRPLYDVYCQDHGPDDDFGDCDIHDYYWYFDYRWDIGGCLFYGEESQRLVYAARFDHASLRFVCSTPFSKPSFKNSSMFAADLLQETRNVVSMLGCPCLCVQSHTPFIEFL